MYISVAATKCFIFFAAKFNESHFAWLYHCPNLVVTHGDHYWQRV
jgi:hypothetical protein